MSNKITRYPIQKTDKDFFVIGDIHGCLNELTELLTHWNEKTEQLVFIGDFIDRGPNSFGVLNLAHDLVQNHGAWAVKGNHEEMFLNVDNPSDEALYLVNGGDTTYDSFPISWERWKTKHSQVSTHYPELIQFMDELPHYIETEHIIFAHAGIQPLEEDWQVSQNDCLWIRDFFHHSPTIDPRWILFGHTPTQFLNKDQSTDIWQKDNKIGIDGGCVFGGQLHGVKLTPNGSITNIHSIQAKP